MVWRLILLSVGVFCAATSVVMTKASTLTPEWLSAGRLLVAAAALLPVFLRDKKRYPEFSFRSTLTLSFLPALLLAFHFITWTVGARWTTSTNATLIVNLIPVTMPFFSFFLLRETINGKELLGTALVFIGVLILGYSDFILSTQLLAGDLVCVLSMLLLTWYLILARKNKSVPSIWLYLVPLFTQAGFMCLFSGLIRSGMPTSLPPSEWIHILLLGLIPTVCGHSLLNWAMHWFRSQLVAIVNQLQFVYAGILGYLFFREQPPWSFYLASSFMLAGVVWSIFTKIERTNPRS